MKRVLSAALVASALSTFGSAAMAQSQQGAQQSPAVAYLQSTPASEQPDVVLDVPNLSVDEITLEVENLGVNIALDARLANLLKLTAGADVKIDQVSLSIKGVQAQAALIVRLDNVRAIIERTLQTLEKNPEIITTLGSTLNTTVETAGGVVNNTVGTVGDLTRGILGKGQTLDLARSGLSVVSETTNAAGEIVRRLRGSDGRIFEVVTDSANKILRSTAVG